MRINKYLSSAGVCSRRGADELIEGGRVLIDGRVAQIGSQVEEGLNVVTVDGKEITIESEAVVIAYNKPVGVVCSLKAQGRDEKCLTDVIDYDGRIYPVGRLDKDSEGLVLLTNDGDLADRVMRAGDSHEKEYLVRTTRVFDASFLQKMSKGVPIMLEKDGKSYEYITKCCTAEAVDSVTFRIILTEGKNRQIRKMCQALGYSVESLKRVRIMGITLGELDAGQHRFLDEEEIKILT